MKLAITFGPMCLTFRKTLGFAGHRQDARGLSGSEIGFIRIAQELHALGHDVTAYTVSDETEFEGIKIRPLGDVGEIDDSTDATISINEPDTLRPAKSKLRVCEFWLNEFSFCKPAFDHYVDLFVSPSLGHLNYHFSKPTWPLSPKPSGEPSAEYAPSAEKWLAIPLGCDPGRYDGIAEKVPGRVVYCSSPDRGLHWLLQEWPAIKQAVPHATLKIFYRLRPWLDSFKEVKYYPPIESLRSRALYIEEALRRMQDPKWRITVCDSVSREQIEREMCEAEVLAYPVDTTQWSEGFSCTTIETCAARACPQLWDCDAIGSIYGDACEVYERGDLDGWRKGIIWALTNSDHRQRLNELARELAEKLTWKNHVKQLEQAIAQRLSSASRR